MKKFSSFLTKSGNFMEQFVYTVGIILAIFMPEVTVGEKLMIIGIYSIAFNVYVITREFLVLTDEVNKDA